MDRTTNPLAISAAALARSADLDQTLSALLGAATESTGAVVGAVLVEDPDRPGLQLLASTGMSPEADRSFEADANDESNPIAVAARELSPRWGTS